MSKPFNTLIANYISMIFKNIKLNEEPEELIRYAALIHNSVMTATSTEQWETSYLVNDAFGTTSWLFQDVSNVTFIVFHRVVRQHHLFALVFTPVPDLLCDIAFYVEKNCNFEDSGVDLVHLGAYLSLLRCKNAWGVIYTFFCCC
jgi:hypothetical protein